MAARLRKPHQEEVRLKIQSSQLINALSDHVKGKKKLSPTQVRAAEILLRKCVPDLSSTTIGGDPENPLVFDAADAVAALLQRPALNDDDSGDSPADSDTVQ